MKNSVAALLLATLAVGAAASGYYAETTSCNSFVGCTPIDVPVVLNAFVNQSSGMSNCGIAIQGYPQAVVCDVTLFAGAQGTIVMNMTSENGNSSVAFGLYSSEDQYVQFTSTYPCLYSTSPPDYNFARCPVTSAGVTYRFNYTVSPNLPAQTEAVLTVEVTKTCCWP